MAKTVKKKTTVEKTWIVAYDHDENVHYPKQVNRAAAEKERLPLYASKAEAKRMADKLDAE